MTVPKVYAKYKKSNYIKITLKHSQTKKLMPGVRVNVDILRNNNMGFGDTYITNSNSQILIQTSGLKKATYSVTVKSGTSSCSFSAKSSLVIR